MSDKPAFNGVYETRGGHRIKVSPTVGVNYSGYCEASRLRLEYDDNGDVLAIRSLPSPEWRHPSDDERHEWGLLRKVRGHAW